MPIHDLGYRPWRGNVTSRLSRWQVIAGAGIRLAWKNHWLRRMALFAWMPALYFVLGFLAYEFLAEHLAQGRPGRIWAESFLGEGLPIPRELKAAILQDPSVARPTVWRYWLLLFFRSPQALLLVMVIGLIAPPLIARDIRTRAFILYFSRPLDRLEYILGKASVIWTFGLCVTALPALALYGVAVLLSPSLSVVQDTWDLPLRILGASAVLLVPTTLLAMMFSSLVTESRYASFAWFAVWILGWVTYGSYVRVTALGPGANAPGAGGAADGWLLLSLYHTLGRAEEWVFGMGSGVAAARPALVLLLAIALLSFAILFRRVSSPMRQ